MDFGEFCRTLKISDADAEMLFAGFQSSAEAFPGPDKLEYLTGTYLDMVLPWIDLEADDAEMLRHFAERLRNDRSAALLFFHAHRSLFYGDDPKRLAKWPKFTATFGQDASLFYLLLSGSVFAPTLEKYRQSGIPAEYAKKLGAKIKSTNWLNRQAFGEPGYEKQVIYWLRQYTDLKVLPVGRFEFRYSTADKYNIVVCRHRSSGEVLALFGRFPCGFRTDGSCCPVDAPDAVSSSGLIEDGDRLIGHAADPASGRSLGIVMLDKREWAKVIAPESPILEWHIPGGGGMTPEITRKSLAEGFDFFERYFPTLPPPKAIMCSSWAFWHRYEELRPNANPALAMRECYEFGRPVRGWNGFYFLFGVQNPDELPGPPPRDTSIRRCMLDVMEKDGFLSTGGVFILREDLRRWGSMPYRNELRVKDIDRYLFKAAEARR